MIIRIPNSEIQELLIGKNYKYPKYATQIINLANQNAQGTRAKVVGQMSDLIQEFEGSAIDEWEKWYLEGRPDAIDNATDKVFNMIELFKKTIVDIDRETVRNWIEELVIVKTFSGLKFQQAILKKVATIKNLPYRLATPVEESKGIDGFIGEHEVSIKPISYKSKLGLNEFIDMNIIYYDKKKPHIVIEFNF